MTDESDGYQAVDEAFGKWEQVRRRLYERECDWARAVTVTGDPQRLRPLQRDLVRLRDEAARAFGRAMCALNAGEPARSRRATAGG